MRACDGTHIKDLPWDWGAYDEFINGLTQVNSYLF